VHKLGACSGAVASSTASGGRQLQQVHAVMRAHGCGSGLEEGVQDADGVGLVHEAGHLGFGGPAEV
jgi:hypothetical protein